LIDTLTSAPGRIVSGALPLASTVATNSTLHSVGQQVTGYAGALIASTVIHLGLKLIDYLKKKYSKSNDNTKSNSETSSATQAENGKS
jgi:hypothetical protein